jgi:hypothetical protein
MEFKSEKQIDNEKNELIKQLRKQNTEMLEMLDKAMNLIESLNCNALVDEIEQLIKEATEL